MITFSQHVPKKDKIGLPFYNRTLACTEVEFTILPTVEP